jgi:hypothetical protein
MLQTRQRRAGTSHGSTVRTSSVLTRCTAAQVAEQQGRYLARYLNAEARAQDKEGEVRHEPFKYRQLGAMASVGARPRMPGHGLQSQFCACQAASGAD